MKLLRLYQDQAREHPGEAKYMLVANAIAQGIEDGCLAPGESLPTHRELAEALGVTIGTVSRGYAEAAQRGLTVGVTGRGTFVTAPCHDVDVYEGAGRMHDLGFIAPFEYLNPDLNEAVAELSRYADLKELSNYQQPRGLLRHREAGAHWAGRYGLAVSPENLLVCAGAQHALLTVLASLFNPGDRIAAEQLSYPLLKQLARRLRLNLTPVRMDQGGMLPDSLEAACRAGGIKGLYLMPTCQNPTLAQIPEYRRRELVDICRRYDVMIIEDDVYALSFGAQSAAAGVIGPGALLFHRLHERSPERWVAYRLSVPAGCRFCRTGADDFPTPFQWLLRLWPNWRPCGSATARRIACWPRSAVRRRSGMRWPVSCWMASRWRRGLRGFFCWLKLPDPCINPIPHLPQLAVHFHDLCSRKSRTYAIHNLPFQLVKHLLFHPVACIQ